MAADTMRLGGAGLGDYLVGNRRRARGRPCWEAMDDETTTEYLRRVMPLCATLGVRVDAFTADAVVLSLDWSPALSTSGGLLHGGTIMALADSAGGACAFLNLPDGAAGTSTIESKTNFLGAVEERDGDGHGDATAPRIDDDRHRDIRARRARPTRRQGDPDAGGPPSQIALAPVGTLGGIGPSPTRPTWRHVMAEAVPNDTQDATVGPPPTAGLTAKQRARRERVIDAALTLLESRDYERIQVKDVAEAASVALGTIYHYFSSKDHLFAEVLLKWAASLRTNVARHPLSGTSPAGAVDVDVAPPGRSGHSSGAHSWLASSPPSSSRPIPSPSR